MIDEARLRVEDPERWRLRRLAKHLYKRSWTLSTPEHVDAIDALDAIALWSHLP